MPAVGLLVGLAAAFGVLWAIFGDPAFLLRILLFNNVPHPALLAVGLFGAIVTGAIVRRSSGPEPTFLSMTLMPPAMALCGLLSVALVAEVWRRVAIERFGAEMMVQQSFFASMRSLRTSESFTPHALLLKQCLPYAWSYGAMAFFDMPLEPARKVAPETWFAPGTRCGPPAK